MIIDSHVHFGKSVWGDFSAEELIKIIDNQVDYAICSNLEGIESIEFKDEYDCNIKMLEISKKYPKLKPLLVCQPTLSNDEKTIRNLIENHSDFIGLKMHPECLKLPANDEKYDKYLRLAEEFNLPCLYHSGHTKSRFSSPYLIYEKAKQFPTVPIILGHLSTGPTNCHKEAIQILLESIEKDNANLYVDTSWIDFAYEKLNETYSDTIMLIESLKNSPRGDFTHKILWATDCPVGEFNHSKESYKSNLEVFCDRIAEYFKDDELLAKILYKNSKDLFKI